MGPNLEDDRLTSRLHAGGGAGTSDTGRVKGRIHVGAANSGEAAKDPGHGHHMERAGIHLVWNRGQQQ